MGALHWVVSVPDLCSIAKRKKSITTIKETSNSYDCLLRALPDGVALVEKKNSSHYKHLSRVKNQTVEKKTIALPP